MLRYRALVKLLPLRGHDLWCRAQTLKLSPASVLALALVGERLSAGEFAWLAAMPSAIVMMNPNRWPPAPGRLLIALSSEESVAAKNALNPQP